MFAPIYQLNIDNEEAKKVQKRWNDHLDSYKHVIELIRNGAGEDFLQQDYESGRLPFLRDMWDLRGINYYNFSK